MSLLTRPTFGPSLSIALILGGTLLDVWTLVWRYTVAEPPLSSNQQFWYLGFLLTGLTLLVVGLFFGQIGRAARRMELAPTEVQSHEVAIQQTAAANPPAVAAVHPPVAPANAVPQPVAPVAPAVVRAPATNPSQTNYSGV